MSRTDVLLQRLHDRTARIVVLGQGYVGLVLAMRATEAGFRVVGLDTDRQRTQLLAAGQSFIEDVPDSVLKAALAAGYRPTSDPDALGDFDVAVISVPTPLREGGPDLSFIEAAAEMLAPRLKQDCLVVLESTTYPGTTEELVAPILEAGSAEGLLAGNGFFLGYSPERIDPGNPSFGLENTPKIVAGIDEASLQVTRAFFDAFVSKTVPVSGCGTAELAKVIENTFRHVNIALVNEIAMFAHDLGIDVSEAIDAAATKPFGFMRFTPGPGVGGHCLPIDPTYLSWRVKQHLGESFRFIELANDINEHMPHYVVRRVTAALNRDKKAVNGSTIVLLGLSYKPNVADIREAPSLPIIEQLHAQGAMVSTVDPFVDTCSAAGATHHRQIDLDLLERADLVVIVTDHDQFDYDAVVQRSRRILDTRGRLSESRAEGVERL